MKEILNHLTADKQYVFLQNFFGVFLPSLNGSALAQIIQKIMNEINER